MKETDFINTFPEKVVVWDKWTNLGPDIGLPHNSGSALRVFFRILYTERGR